MATCFHIDMDAFYASVEQLDNPWLKGRCVIVGGISGRGVVSAASYEARRHGVRSAMPVFEARRRCPQGVFLPPRMARYKEVSRQVMGILREFTPLVEVVSIDEAYLDLSGSERLHGDAAAAARRIKARIREATGLSCSVGVAPLKFLAKIASDLEKPDGLTIIAPGQVMAVIDRLPIEKVPGVGPKTAAQLALMGVRHLGEVRRFSPEILVGRLGKYGLRLRALACGEDPTPVVPQAAHKSVSCERTLHSDTADVHLLRRLLLAQSEEVGRHLRRLGQRARTVTLKLKHDDFRLVTRATTLAAPTDSAQVIYRAACGLLDAYRLRQKVRLVGVGAGGLGRHTPPVQLSLFGAAGDRQESWRQLERALDSIRDRFGMGAIRRASLDTEESR